MCQACSVKVSYRLELYADLVTARCYKGRMQSRPLLTILHRNVVVQFVIEKRYTIQGVQREFKYSVIFCPKMLARDINVKRHYLNTKV